MENINRRSFIKIVGGSALAVALQNVLTGCGGGGGGGGGGGSASPVIKPGVVALPSDGSVTIVSSSSTQIVLSGKVPTLAVGSVIVSGLGTGFIAKVTSVSISGGTTTALVSAATCEDIFSQGTITLQKTLAFSDLATVTPMLSGVTVTAPSGSNAAHPRSALSLNKGFDLNFGQVEVSGDISVNGSANCQLALDDSIVVDSQGIKSVTFLPSLTVTGTLTITGTITAEVSNKVQYLHVVCDPQLIWIELVPVVFVPQFDFYFAYDAKANGVATFTATVASTVAAGLQYQRGSGWSPISQPPTTTCSFVPAANFLAELTVTPVHLEFSELIYGLVGPTAFLDAPTLDAELQINPPSHTVPGYELDCTATFDLSAGYTVQALGHTFADSPVTGSLSKSIGIFDEFFPDSNITVNVVPGRKKL